jgi:hypothetical protein
VKYIPAAKRYLSTAREKNNAVAGPVSLFSVVVHNKSTSGDRWLHVFDKATAPALNEVPLLPPLKVAAGEVKGWSEEAFAGLALANGLAFGLSTTEDTYTAPASAEGWFYARYFA